MRIIIKDGNIVRCIQNIQESAKIEIISEFGKSFQVNDDDFRYQTFFFKVKEVE